MNIQQLKRIRNDLRTHWYYIRRLGANYSDNWIRDINNVAKHINAINQLIDAGGSHEKDSIKLPENSKVFLRKFQTGSDERT